MSSFFPLAPRATGIWYLRGCDYVSVSSCAKTVKEKSASFLGSLRDLIAAPEHFSAHLPHALWSGPEVGANLSVLKYSRTDN